MPPSLIDKGNRWDGTTPTDTRSQRSRTSRRGGQLLTRARSPLSKNGLPIRVPRRPLFRTVTPYARLETPSQRNRTRTLASFIPGTNAIESLNARYRRAVKARGHFPTEQAAMKCLYLVTRSLDPKGTGQTRWATRWKPALNAFAITFADRMPTKTN
jgi:Transposase, Mutator family